MGLTRRMGWTSSRMVRGLFLVLAVLGLLAATASTLLADAPQNIIIMIGDGMGFEQVKAAACYNGAPLCFESLPVKAEMTTRSANNAVTDSAASATAMASGYKVNNNVVNLALPANEDFPEAGTDMPTSLEHFRDLGKATGVVSTTNITHATPAAFGGAHTVHRNRYSEITSDLLYNSQPTVMFGGGGEGMCVSEAENTGYRVVTDRASLQRLVPVAGGGRAGGARGSMRGGAGARGGMMMGGAGRGGARYCGQFGDGYMPYEYDEDYSTLPHLSEMTAVALQLLDDDPDGFFLMVEGGRIDHAGHGTGMSRDLRTMRNIFETIEFANSVQEVLDWMGDRTDTLLIVTADHETGGLNVVADKGKGIQPDVTWAHGNHSGVNVPVYAIGPNSEMISDVIDNTDIHWIAIAVPETANTIEEEPAVVAP